MPASALLLGACATPSTAHAAAPARTRCAVHSGPAFAARRAEWHAGGQRLPAVRAGKGHGGARRAVAPPRAALKALLWDCDGVILESEDLHRRAYNATFAHFGVQVDGKARRRAAATSPGAVP